MKNRLRVLAALGTAKAYSMHVVVVFSIAMSGAGLQTARAQDTRVLTDHFNYLVGETINATFSGGPGNPKDWVGIYPDGTAPGSATSTIWFYVDGTQSGNKGLTEGTLSFVNGLSTAGDWVAYFLLNDGYTALSSNQFKVLDVGTPFLRLNKREYQPNEPISAAFTNGPANPKDWIGIYPSDREPGNGTALTWNYVDGTQNGATGQSEGLIQFPGGLANPGQYIAYFLVNDGYTALSSEPFTVASSVSTGPRVISISPAPNTTNAPPLLEFSATLTNGVAPIATDSIVLSIDTAVVPITVRSNVGLVTVTYTNKSVFAAGSTHSYLLIYADTATPAHRGTNQATFTVSAYSNIQLPAPLYFENFDSTPEGQLPAGWNSVSYSDVSDENVDLQDLNSKAYANWVVVSRDRFTQPFLSYDAHEPTSDYLRVLSVNPMNVVNGQFVRDLITGKFVFADSGYRSGGNQFLILYTPDFDLGAKTNTYLSFHSVWEQNQDSIAAVEYSIDQGTVWLPIVYMLDQPDVARDAAGNIDAITTFTADQSDVAHYTDPTTGEDKGGTYGAFIGAAISADLAPFISPRTDDDPVGSKRVELFRLPKADHQSKVRFRFAHAGTDSWYFGIDDFGLYSIASENSPGVSLQFARSPGGLVLSWPADAVGYVLESSGSLNPPDWKPVDGVTGNSVTIPMTNARQFFRLRQ